MNDNHASVKQWREQIIKHEERRLAELKASLERLKDLAEEIDNDGNLTETAITMLNEAIETIADDEERACNEAENRLEAARSGKIALMDAAIHAAKIVDPDLVIRFRDDEPEFCDFCGDYLQEIVARLDDGRSLRVPLCGACNLAFVIENADELFAQAAQRL